jgi:hypothetical protein
MSLPKVEFNSFDQLELDMNIEKNHLIVFDWDDTLFANFELEQYVKKINNSSQTNEFEELLDQEKKRQLYLLKPMVYTVLKKALQYGHVVILTNASKKWVNITCELLYPDCLDFLNQIEIISAFENHSKEYPQALFMWKLNSFYECINKYKLLGSVKYIISVGDSPLEMESTICSPQKIKAKKIIKFVERPTIKHLYEQLKMFCNMIEFIISSESSMNLQMSITQ